MFASRRARRAAVLSAVAVLALGFTGCSSDGDDEAVDGGGGSQAETGDFSRPSGAVRGFDGTTIRVASLGIKGQLPGVEWGAKARIERFNQDEEIPGVEIEYTEYADDKFDPASALSEARRLVTAEDVFAIVGDVSANNPGQFFEQQKVPYFGWGFDTTYCSDESSTELWGYSIYGCGVPEDPSVVGDNGRLLYEYVNKKTGKENPTFAIFANDTEAGKNSVRFGSVAFEAAGFDVVMAEGLLPPPPISDYTPYAQELLRAADGKQPDTIVCYLSLDCISMWQRLKAGGFTGTYMHTLYSDALAGAMQGTLVSLSHAPLEESTPAVEQMKSDVAEVKPDQAIDSGVLAGYLSAEMFIQSLKIVAKEDVALISPANVQRAASTMTFEVEGLVGPFEYPASTVTGTPLCTSLVEGVDGKGWTPVAEFSCSDRTFEVK